MRVLIFSMPRCGSFAVEQMISSTFGVKSMDELFGYCSNIDDAAKVESELPESCVFKIMGQNLAYVDLVSLCQRINPDYLIVMTRVDTVSMCVSWYMANIKRVYHYVTVPGVIKSFVCTEEFVRSWCMAYRMFNERLLWLNSARLNVIKVSYEDVCANVPIKIGTKVLQRHNLTSKSSNFDYKKICTNYDQVSEWITQWTN